MPASTQGGAQGVPRAQNLRRLTLPLHSLISAPWGPPLPHPSPSPRPNSDSRACPFNHPTTSPTCLGFWLPRAKGCLWHLTSMPGKRVGLRHWHYDLLGAIRSPVFCQRRCSPAKAELYFLMWVLGLIVPASASQLLAALPHQPPGSEAMRAATAGAAGIFGKC